MVKRMGWIIDRLLDHYLVVNLLLALIILTMVGVGEIKVVSLLGLLLCATGIVQSSIPVDLWTLVPLIVYNLVSMASSYAVYGNITDGYASTQMIFPVIYLLTAGLGDGEQRLLKRLCTWWAGAAALAGIGQFIGRVLLEQRAWRVGGFLGNPNAMGIFLVIGWFSLINCTDEIKETKFLPYVEPVLLVSLALTLSMGSFIAMAAGIMVLVLDKKRCSAWTETLHFTCCILARASLGMGTGMLIYLSAARTNVPLLCLLLLMYAGAVMCCWKMYLHFLRQKPRTAAAISAMGILVAAAAVIVRPSSLATFAERLEMMQNGLHYFFRNPLLGVGPYQWRVLNLHDGGKYFNTWHIHNLLIHIGVELGWIALGLLVWIAIRFFRKHTEPAEKAGFTAFCFHNLMDTSFFYMGILSLTMLALGNPERKAKMLPVRIVRGLFILSAVLFVYHLYYGVRAGQG